jgi:very-short-patch-repair endonuclease
MNKSRKMRLSRELRQRSTYSETLAWNILRSRRIAGYKFRRQYGVCGFILDFYCFELKLAIEIDGGFHDTRKDYDAMRQEIIEREGISFVRISADDLVESPERLPEKIEAFISANKTLTFPSPAELERDQG